MQGNAALERAVDQSGLELVGPSTIEAEPHGKDDDLERLRRWCLQNSGWIGRLRRPCICAGRYQVNLLAVTRGDRRITARLRESRFRVGDVVVLQGRRSRLEALRELGCLPLAERNVTLGQDAPRWLAPAILLVRSCWW